MTIVTRFAPSPTGYLHLGSFRTVLFNFLYTRQKKGKFILRVEDTDRARFVEGSMENMLAILTKLGLEPDEGPNKDGGNGPYIQSERLSLYSEHIKTLLENDNAYYCFCSSERLDSLRSEQKELGLPTKYDKKCRYLTTEEVTQKLEENIPHTIRLKVPDNTEVSFKDGIKGKITVPSKDIDEQVLIKTDGFPTYHFAVVVDDHLMGITDIIRGDEWIPSTPKHILLYNAFGWKMPTISHVPPLVGADRKKLSKRTGDVAVEKYLAKGYLIEALINYLALLGWNPKTTQEFFSMDELIEKFDLSGVHKAGAFFDVERLDFFNSHYIKNTSNLDLYDIYLEYLKEYDDDFREIISNQEKEYILKVMGELKQRLKNLSELKESSQYFFTDPKIPNNDLILNPKMKIESSDQVITSLNLVLELLQGNTTDTSSIESIKDAFISTIKEKGMKNGQVLWPTRCVLSGEQFSPGAFEMIYILGKAESIRRIETYVNHTS